MDKLYEKWIYFYVVNVSAWKNNMEYKYMFMFPQNLSTHHVVPRVQLKNKLWFTTLCELMKGGFSAFHLCRCKLHSSYSCIVCYQLGESSAWGMRCFHPRSNTNNSSASSSQTCYPRNYNRTGSHIGISSNVMTPTNTSPPPPPPRLLKIASRLIGWLHVFFAFSCMEVYMGWNMTHFISGLTISWTVSWELYAMF